jgi:SAM-dependent methyltransferase
MSAPLTTEPTDTPAERRGGEWFGDWQAAQHAVAFDNRSGLDRRNLLRNQEGFNDVRLLNEWVPPARPLDLVEVGCATGEFARYLRYRHPSVRYHGLDISEPAIARARSKYPRAAFAVTDPELRLAEALAAAKFPAQPEVVYSKDVVQHQTDPFGFVADLLAAGREAVVLRCRTRDVGPSELDPARSCQFHYSGWMPYLVLNLQELIEHITRLAPGSDVDIWRHHMILGGVYNRFVPKDLYLKEMGTAETAIRVIKPPAGSGRVTLLDRLDHNPRYTWDYLLKHAIRQGLAALQPAGPSSRTW